MRLSHRLLLVFFLISPLGLLTTYGQAIGQEFIDPKAVALNRPDPEAGKLLLRFQDSFLQAIFVDPSNIVIPPPYEKAYTRYQFISHKDHDRIYNMVLTLDASGAYLAAPHVVAPPYIWLWIGFKDESNEANSSNSTNNADDNSSDNTNPKSHYKEYYHHVRVQ